MTEEKRLQGAALPLSYTGILNFYKNSVAKKRGACNKVVFD